MAFDLKSGNGPLPFKEMGSSPAKHVIPRPAQRRVAHNTKYGKGHATHEEEEPPTKMTSPAKQKVDLTKKSGFGPMEIKEDDQSRKAHTIKYEQGNPLGIENPVALEKLYEKTEKPRQ